MRRLRTKEQIQTECQIQRIYFTKHYSNINNSGYNWSSVPYAIVAKRAKKLPSWTKCWKKKSTKIELKKKQPIRNIIYIHMFMYISYETPTSPLCSKHRPVLHCYIFKWTVSVWELVSVKLGSRFLYTTKTLASQTNPNTFSSSYKCKSLDYKVQLHLIL